jgi:ABC-type multidrug transport system fused ATPase/permease subunit
MCATSYLGVYIALTIAVLACVVYGRMVWAYGTSAFQHELPSIRTDSLHLQSVRLGKFTINSSGLSLVPPSGKLDIQHCIKHLYSLGFRWLDVTPTSRILVRATDDIQGADDSVPQRMNWVFDIAISMVVYLGAICIVSPQVLLPGILVAAAGALVGQIYVRAMLGFKREMSVAKAPVLAMFSSTISGLGMGFVQWLACVLTNADSVYPRLRLRGNRAGGEHDPYRSFYNCCKNVPYHR